MRKRREPAPSRGRGTAPGRAAPKAAPDRRAGARVPGREVHKITSLEQMKVLADPLRLRILELFCEERTTKQVAGILEQPLTRLYHHVAALERVGLIRLARTQQRRGALEKYYLAVAKTFSADSRLFSSGASAQVVEAAGGVATQGLENTLADLRALLEQGEGLLTLKQEGILSYLEVRASPKELKAIRNKIAQVLRTTTRKESDAGGPSTRYRLTIAFFPLVDGRRSTPGSS